MEFDAGQCPTITKAIIEPIVCFERLRLLLEHTIWRAKITLWFSTENIDRSCLIITVCVHDVKLKHALIDPGSSLNYYSFIDA